MPGSRFSAVHLLSLALLAGAGGLLCYPGDGEAPGDRLTGEVQTLRTHLREGRYREALLAAQDLLAQQGVASGPDSADRAEALDAVIESLWRGGEVGRESTLDLARRAVELRERLHGSQSREVVGSLNSLAVVLYNRSEFDASRPVFERALAILEGDPSADPMAVASLLNSFAQLVIDSGNRAEAKALAERALAMLEAAGAPESAEAAVALGNLGYLAEVESDFTAAISRFERAVDIQQRKLAAGHPDLAETLTRLSVTLSKVGDYRRAVAEAERSLALRERALGADHVDVAKSLNNLALVLHRQGKTAEARPLLERALAILERSFGSDHVYIAGAANNLSVLVSSLGDYKSARALNEKALAAGERAFPADHPDYAALMNTVGLFFFNTGDLARARHMYDRALAIMEKNFGDDHPVVAIVLQNQGDLQSSLGDHWAARSLYERAARITERLMGPDHPDTATSLSMLASSLQETGEYLEAEALYLRAHAIRERALGAEHPDVAFSLTDMAALAARRGDLDTAKRHLLRARELHEAAWGAIHPYTAATLTQMAKVLIRLGEMGTARATLEQAMDAGVQIYGSQHVNVAGAASLIAKTHFLMGDMPRALEAAMRAEEIVREEFTDTARSLSEREALNYESLRSSGLDVAFSVLGAPGGEPYRQAAVGSLWEEVVRSRAMVLDEMASRNRISLESATPEVGKLLDELEVARNYLARLAVQMAGSESAHEYRDRLQRARERKEEVERLLAERSAEFRARQEGSRAGMREVAGALPEGSALVGYVQYGQWSPAGGVQTPSAPIRTPSYVALVMPHRGGTPVAVPLGPCERIDALVRTWRLEAEPAVARLSSVGPRAEARYREAGMALRRAIWDPLQEHVAKAEQVFVVPDGALHLVNLGALPAEDGRYLVETGPLLHYFSAERDLVAGRRTPRGRRGLLALGGPDFDAAPHSASPRGAGRGAEADSDPTLFRGRRAACVALGSMKFAPLPAARTEVEEITRLWQRRQPDEGAERARMLLSASATESEFKRSAPGHRVLHLATHGFFASERCPSALEEARSAEGAPWQRMGQERGNAENPLLLSGLALAGANRREQAPEGVEDGILTAEEIASLDLGGVEWAVLSACETGVGQVQNGEGVLGLRRAFEVAGAGTLIMSLWSVEDAVAREWMRGLYEARLGDASTIDAVRQASVKMIEARRRAGKSTHPASWGAFVAAGDWR